jgi:hypothetical protein
MQSRELVELAALVALHSPVLAQGHRRVPQGTIEQYWTAARCRIDRWLRLLRRLAAASHESPLPATLSYARVRPVLEEILASEPLVRIFTATAAAYDAERGDQDLEPIARSIYTGHLDVRCRLLQLLAEGRVIDLPSGVALNHLRRRLERWTDLLLAHLSPLVSIDEFAFEPARARDFSDDLAGDAAADRGLTWQLMLASLRGSLSGVLADRSPNVDLNRRVGAAVLGCFRDDTFNTTALTQSLWLERISRTASETEGMIDELLRLEAR